jgi:hypothetical protein
MGQRICVGLKPETFGLLLLLLNMLMPAQLNSFTHLRVLLVLHGRGILAHATSVAGYYSSYLSHSETNTMARVL